MTPLRQLTDAVLSECERLQGENDMLRAEVSLLKMSCSNTWHDDNEGSMPSLFPHSCSPKSGSNSPKSWESINNEMYGRGDATGGSDSGTVAHRIAEGYRQGLYIPSKARDIQKKEVTCTVRTVVKGNVFEFVYCLLTFMNAICLAFNAQYEGIDLGHDLGVSGYPSSAGHTWPGAEQVFGVLEMFFGCIFMIELVLKLYALRLDFRKSLWNLLDIVIIACWISFQLGVVIHVNPIIIRLLRLVRLARLVRLMSSLEAFDSLRVIVLCLSASMPVLFWANAILLVFEAVVGLCLQSLLMDYMHDTSRTVDDRVAVFMHFGTFTRTLTTMIELTFGNFMPVTQLLTEHVSEAFGYLILLYKLTIGFAMLRVISGVFLHETFKVAAADDEFMVVQKKRGTAKHIEKMMKLVKMADESQDGFVQRSEFDNFLDDESMKVWLAAQDIDVANARLLFDLLDSDGDGKLSTDEVCSGIARLKGAARSSDLLSLIHLALDMSETIKKLESQRKPSVGSPVSQPPAPPTTAVVEMTCVQAALQEVQGVSLAL